MHFLQSPARRRSCGRVGVAAVLSALASQGCLDRDVARIAPESDSVVVHEVTVSVPDKVDLLLMVDNSSSMNDKQTELTRRVPTLIQLLTNPQKNPDGSTPKAVTDIHVGVITSSLGSYGTPACDPTSPDMNDHGHLMPRTAAEAEGNGFSYNAAAQDAPLSHTCPTPVVASAVSWTFAASPSSAPQFNGGGDGVVELETATSCVVASVNENGCGYEASLEAVYHFLIDPAPYQSAAATCTTDKKTGVLSCSDIAVTGVDTTLLAERNAFLRPDSLLAVIIMTDENDGSINVQQGVDWTFAGLPAGGLPRGWKACESLPDDLESDDHDALVDAGCQWCYLDDKDPDHNCDVPWSSAGATDTDQINLRMFQQTQRYGINGLYPRQRYVDGFTKETVKGSDGKLGPNGIYAGGTRTPADVVVATIVGVPENLVADASHNPLAPDVIDWEKIVSADPKARDPHMIESILPRPGIPLYKPASGDSNTLGVMPGFTDTINGGDRPMPFLDDLQYACIGFRSTTKPDETFADCCDNPANRDCTNVSSNPVCSVDSSGAITQPRYKAYPGLRELRMLHEIWEANPAVSTVAASICAQSFAPAVESIVAKLQAVLDSLCVQSELKQDDASKQVNCVVAEVFASDTFGTDPTDAPGACEAIGNGYCTPGSAPCRLANDPDAGSDQLVVAPIGYASEQLTLPVATFDADAAKVIAKYTSSYVSPNNNVFIDTVDATGTKTRHLVCEELQLTSNRTAAITQAVTDSCVNDATFSLPSGLAGGWCYSTVDEVIGPKCKALGSTGTIRFLGGDKPHDHSQVFTVCNE